ncbi:MAG: GGDEF domain-containing protein [Hydrogenothermaceae bacterium]
MKKNKEKIILIIGVFVIYLIIVILLYIDKTNKENIYLSGKIEQTESEILVTLEKFENLSNLLTNSEIRKPEIASIISTADLSKRYITFNNLQDDFRFLKSYGYDNILFILPDGSLFLDMKKPENAGKKLINIDNIFVVSNTLKNSIDNRFYDSVTYSYPVFYGNKLIAYVYYTVPFYTIGKNLSDIFRNLYVFYIKKDYISLSSTKGYIQSDLNENYFVDRKFYNLKIKTREENIDLISEINRKLKEKIKDRLQKEQSFAVPIEIEGKYYIVIFYSIKDLTDKHIGYIVSYKAENTIFEFEKSFYISISLISLIVVLIAVAIYQILKMKAIAEKNAITDKLTGAFNRMAIEPIINAELDRSKRNNKPISLIIFDIDFFKKINDRYGHDKGDYVLKNVTEIIKRSIRKSDYLIRWGGEEFLLILPETDIDGAKKLAEKLRTAVENYSFKDVGQVTISLGITQMKTVEPLDNAIKRADEALYTAKNRGRNRVEFNYY